jgi:hypothetical protein
LFAPLLSTAPSAALISILRGLDHLVSAAKQRPTAPPRRNGNCVPRLTR